MGITVVYSLLLLNNIPLDDFATIYSIIWVVSISLYRDPWYLWVGSSEELLLRITSKAQDAYIYIVQCCAVDA
jgi:hypothetical protein